MTVYYLLVGLPDQRPGGLLLSILTGVGSGFGAVVVGTLYATVCVEAPWVGLGLQAVLAVLRGVPVLLLMFVLAQLSSQSPWVAGMLALFLYSLSQVGETLRSFLDAYPAVMRDQARLMGLGFFREWAQLRLPWTFQRSLDALGTHWISLLKDTGALTVLGIGELTTVARILSEQASVRDWQLVLATAAALYLGATIALIRVLQFVRSRYSFVGGGA
jgi:polar amino acid transport system permease protein